MTEGFPVAVDLLLRALAEPGLESRQEVNILCELAWLAHQKGDINEGARYAEAGLVLAEQLADPATLAIALAAVAQVGFARTGGIRHDLLDRALQLERTLDGGGYAAAGWWTWHAGLPMRLSPARVTLALLLGRSDRHAESRDLWRALTAEAGERADPDVVRCLFHRAQTEMAAGAWDTAARLCDEAIQLTRQIGLEVFEPLCLSILARDRRLQRRNRKGAKDDPRTPSSRRGGHVPMGRLPPADRTRGPRAVLRRWRCKLGQVAQPLDDVEELDVYLARLAGSAGIEALLAQRRAAPGGAVARAARSARSGR